MHIPSCPQQPHPAPPIHRADCGRVRDDSPGCGRWTTGSLQRTPIPPHCPDGEESATGFGVVAVRMQTQRCYPKHHEWAAPCLPNLPVAVETGRAVDLEVDCCGSVVQGPRYRHCCDHPRLPSHDPSHHHQGDTSSLPAPAYHQRERERGQNSENNITSLRIPFHSWICGV